MEDITAEMCASAVAPSQHTQPAKRKFFQWAVKWFYANISEECKEKPDASTLACLLQSIGFQLREFDKIELSNTEKRELKSESVKVTIECGTSGMRALLEMDDVKCQCPNSEDAKDASFWSVSGTGPAAATDESVSNKVEESGSNLLPPVSKEIRKVLNEVTYRLLNMISDKAIDVNHNSASRSNLNLSQVSSSGDIMDIVNDGLVKNDSINIVRSRTQPEIAVSGRNSAVRRSNWISRSYLKDGLSRVAGCIPTKGWGEARDLECSESIDGGDQPRPSPPKIASSPVVLNQLCSSLGQISLQSEEEAGNLAEHVIRAHRCLEKAVEILLDKRSPLSRNSPNYEDGTFLKPPTAGAGLNLSGIGGRKKSSSSSSLRTSPTNVANSRPGSSCSMPGRILSSSVSNKQTLGLPAKSPITRRSVGSALSRLSTTPLSTAVSSAKRNIIQPVNNGASGLSKIPGRRKSFGALAGQSLKLSVPTDRNSASGGTKKKSNSPATIPPEERVIITAKRRVSPDPKAIANTSGIQTPGSFQHHQHHNQATTTTSSASTPAASTVAPTLKLAPIKTINQTSKEPPTRKSLANPKFGYCKKKP